MRRANYILVYFLLQATPSLCQIAIQPGDSLILTIDSLVRRLVGPGVLISNIQSNHTNGSLSIGYMSNPSAVFGMQKGFVMSTGRAAAVGQPNTGSFLHFNTTGFGSDPQLSTLLPNTNFVDICAITFDFVPLSDTISFNYVFGSEEYSFYSCPGVVNFNDVFGFFVNGPRPQGGVYQNQNFARLPSTNTNTDIVSINNVTDGGCSQACPANTAFYRSNYVSCFSPSGTFPTAYDGFTIKLNVTIPVVPCASYSIKLILSDVRDALFDSFVLLEEGFVQSPSQVTLSTLPTYARFNDLIEGCHSVQLVAHKQPIDSFAVSIPYTLSGSATPGADYLVNGQGGSTGAFVFAPFADSSVLIVTAVSDSIPDDNEFLRINLYNVCEDTASQPPRGDSALVFIRERFPINAGSDTFRCGTPPVQLSPVGLLSSDQLIWSPSFSMSCTTCSNPFATPNSSTLYTLLVTDSISGCIGEGKVTVFMNEPITFSDTALCTGQSVQLQAGTGGGQFQYQWLAHPTLRPPLNQSIVELVPDDTSRYYYVSIQYPGGCVRTDSVFVMLLPSPRLRALDTVLCTDVPVLLDLQALSPDSARWFAVQQANQTTSSPWRAIIPATPGTYVMTVSLERGPCRSFGIARARVIRAPELEIQFAVQRPGFDMPERVNKEELVRLLPPFSLYAEPTLISPDVDYTWIVQYLTEGTYLTMFNGVTFGPYPISTGGTYGLSVSARYVS